jgi:hypothetical protein
MVSFGRKTHPISGFVVVVGRVAPEEPARTSNELSCLAPKELLGRPANPRSAALAVIAIGDLHGTNQATTANDPTQRRSQEIGCSLRERFGTRGDGVFLTHVSSVKRPHRLKRSPLYAFLMEYCRILL